MNELAVISKPTRAPTLANACIEFISTCYKDRHWRTKMDAQFTMDEFEIVAGHKPVDRNTIARWYEHQDKAGMMASTINKKRIVIKKFLGWCHESGYMKDPPVAFLIPRRQPPKPLPFIFTDEEYERIKEASQGTHSYFMTVIGRNTGMSMIDVCHLRWPSINLEELTIQANRIKVSWRGQNLDLCMIPILANSDLHVLLQELKDIHRPEDGDWVNPDLRLCYAASTWQVVMEYRRLLKKLGIERKSFKNWRNTFISMLANSGMNHALAMKVTGHKDANIFAAYVRPDWEALRSGLQSAFQWAAGKETVKELRKPKNQ